MPDIARMTETPTPWSDPIAWTDAALRAAFQPRALEIIDESSRHAGHSGAVEGEVTHLRLRIQAEALQGLTRIQAHRAIHETLKPAFSAGLHALAIEIENVIKG